MWIIRNLVLAIFGGFVFAVFGLSYPLGFIASLLIINLTSFLDGFAQGYIGERVK